MKLKIDYEYDEAHIASILKVFLPLVDRIMKTVERGQDISLQRAALIHEAQTSTVHYTEPYEEEDSESDEDSDGKVAPAFASIPRPKAVPPMEKSPPPGNSKGRDVLCSLVKAWEVNFNQDGEQPDRLKLLGDITKDRTKIGPLLTYCGEIEGLTRGVHAVRAILHEAPDTIDSRLIASNICQVASCVCPPLADQFKYPNPFDSEKKS
jgi:hypothetical protein